MGLELPVKHLIWDLGPHGGGEGQRQSCGLSTLALAAWDLGLLEKLECQEVVFPGALEGYSSVDNPE